MFCSREQVVSEARGWATCLSSQQSWTMMLINHTSHWIPGTIMQPLLGAYNSSFTSSWADYHHGMDVHAQGTLGISHKQNKTKRKPFADLSIYVKRLLIVYLMAMISFCNSGLVSLRGLENLKSWWVTRVLNFTLLLVGCWFWETTSLWLLLFKSVKQKAQCSFFLKLVVRTLTQEVLLYYLCMGRGQGRKTHWHTINRDQG